MDFHSAEEMQLDYDGSQIFRNFATYVGLSVDLVGIRASNLAQRVSSSPNLFVSLWPPLLCLLMNTLVDTHLPQLRNNEIIVYKSPIIRARSYLRFKKWLAFNLI